MRSTVRNGGFTRNPGSALALLGTGLHTFSPSSFPFGCSFSFPFPLSSSDSFQLSFNLPLPLVLARTFGVAPFRAFVTVDSEAWGNDCVRLFEGNGRSSFVSAEDGVSLRDLIGSASVKEGPCRFGMRDRRGVWPLANIACILGVATASFLNSISSRSPCMKKGELSSP